MGSVRVDATAPGDEATPQATLHPQAAMASHLGADGPPRRASLLAALGAGILQGANLLVFLLITQRLPPAEAGTFRLILVLQALPVVLCGMGWPQALLFMLGRAADEQERGRVFTAACLWMLLSTPALAAGGGLLTLVLGWVQGHPELVRTAWAAAGLAALNSWSIFIAPVLVGRGLPGRFVLFALLQLAVATGATLALTHVSPTLGAALAAAAIAAGMGLLLTVAAFLPVARAAPLAVLWRNYLVPGLHYGSPAALGGFLFAVGYQADHLVASFLFSGAQYGVYAGGAWQLPVGLLAQHGQGTALLSVLAGHHQAQRSTAFWSEWRRATRPAGMLGAVLFWGVFWGAGDLIFLILGPRYGESASVFRVYALLLPLRTVALYLPLRAAGSPRAEVPAGLALLLGNLGVGLLLGTSLGLVGPAFGVVAGMLAWAAYLTWATVQAFRVPVMRFLAIPAVLTSLVLAGVLAGPVFALAGAICPGPSAGRLAVFGGLYLGGAVGLMSLARLRRRASPTDAAAST